METDFQRRGIFADYSGYIQWGALSIGQRVSLKWEQGGQFAAESPCCRQRNELNRSRHRERVRKNRRTITYEPFCFRLDPEIGMLVEYAPTVDHTEERRQYRVAKDEVSKLLRPGQKIRHKELVRKLVGDVFTFGGKNISERTARNYISALSGTFLICNEDGTYSLANPNLEIEYGKERDDGN